MYFTEKKIKHADLVIPFTKCPFKKVEQDCPFIEYWDLASVEKQIGLIENLPEEKLDSLRNHHELCQERKLKNAQNLGKLRSFLGICSSELVLDNL